MRSQGDLARSQGDHARSQGDHVRSQGDHARSQGHHTRSHAEFGIHPAGGQLHCPHLLQPFGELPLTLTLGIDL